MIAPNTRKSCETAALHYYQILSGEQDVPDEIQRHIADCQHCHRQIKLLQHQLDQLDKPGASLQEPSGRHKLVMKQYEYVDTEVTCSTARSFLPILGSVTFTTSVPTPITEHVDHCDPCRAELQQLTALEFDEKRSLHLAQLLTDTPMRDAVDCEKAASHIDDYVQLNFEKIDKEILHHLCTCPVCRDQIADARFRLINIMNSTGKPDTSLPCDSVTMNDLFDYTFAYAFDPGNDPYAKFRNALSDHVVHCPVCLRKMQRLHNTVHTMAIRPDSDIATVFHVKNTAQVSADELPFEVEVISREPAAAVEPVQAQTVRIPRRLHLSPLLKVAAVIVVALLVSMPFVFKTQPLSAVEYTQLRNTLTDVDNIAMVFYTGYQAEPVRQRWISRSLKLALFKNKGRAVLWDINRDQRITRDAATSQVTTQQLDSTQRSQLAGILDIPGILMPFETTGDMPASATWHQLDTPSADGLEIYELRWREESLSGRVIEKTWRTELDPADGLPTRIQWLEKTPDQSQPVLKLRIDITYPDSMEFESAIGQAGMANDH